MKNFKKLDSLTYLITKKVLKKNGYLFVKINENWENIVGTEFYAITNPLKISKDKILTVEVKSNFVLDFQFKTPDILKNCDLLFGDTSIVDIKIIQNF